MEWTPTNIETETAADFVLREQYHQAAVSYADTEVDGGFRVKWSWAIWTAVDEQGCAECVASGYAPTEQAAQERAEGWVRRHGGVPA